MPLIILNKGAADVLSGKSVFLEVGFDTNEKVFYLKRRSLMLLLLVKPLLTEGWSIISLLPDCEAY